MSTAKVSIKSYEDGYTLVVDGEESDEAAYGEVLEFVTDSGKRFLAMVDAEGREVSSVTEYWAYEVSPIEDVQIEDSDEEGEEGEEGEDEGQEGEEGEEEGEELPETV